jgi:hypothetical protein
MTTAAMMAGAAAASSRSRRSSHKLGPALEAEGRNLLGHFGATAPGALDFGFIIENNFFKVLIAAGTMVFKDRHRKAPSFLL